MTRLILKSQGHYWINIFCVMNLNEDIVVGGDFEITIPKYKSRELSKVFDEGYFYSSGRAALYAIIKNIEKTRADITAILVPDYICHTVPETINRTQLNIEVYHLNSEFYASEELVCNTGLSNKAILLVNFFGFMSLESMIQKIHRNNPDCIVIEDNVQSLNSMFLTSSADYRFTSFRKSLSVPDGGWVLTRYQMHQPMGINKFAQYKIAGGILKNLRYYQWFDDSLYLQMLKVGEEKIDDNLDKAISQFTLDFLSTINLTRFNTLRQRNAEYLVKRLKDLCIEPMIPYKKGIIPLFIPIRLKNRDQVRQALFAKQIFCPVHWPVLNQYSDDYTMGKLMHEEELSLIVDQRYGILEMQHIIDVIKENL